MLSSFYGQNGAEKAQSTSTDPLDINGATFKPDIYLTKLLRERSLTELMDKETEMVRHIRSLDSDMQTLVYENYNKFISATDTIRKVNFQCDTIVNKSVKESCTLTISYRVVN